MFKRAPFDWKAFRATKTKLETLREQDESSDHPKMNPMQGFNSFRKTEKEEVAAYWRNQMLVRARDSLRTRPSLFQYTMDDAGNFGLVELDSNAIRAPATLDARLSDNENTVSNTNRFGLITY